MLEFSSCRRDCELSGGFCAMAIAIVFRAAGCLKEGFAARNAAAGGLEALGGANALSGPQRLVSCLANIDYYLRGE